MIISKLKRLYNLDQTIYFEGKLYERLNVLYQHRKYKYRVIFSDDDYDYVTIPALRKRLDRAFKRASK